DDVVMPLSRRRIDAAVASRWHWHRSAHPSGPHRMGHDSVASGRYEPCGVCAALRFGAEHVGAEHVCAAQCGERPMTIRRSTFVTGAAVLGASALLLAACSPGSSDDDSGDGDSGTTTVTFRLWDEAAAAAYEESFAAFEEQNTDIDVRSETVPWANYWDRLPQDIG